MSIILIIVANPEKLHVRLMRFCMKEICCQGDPNLYFDGI